MLKKMLSLSLCVLVFAGFAAGCSRADNGGTAELKVLAAKEPVSLDPALVGSAYDASFTANLFETLVAYTDAAGEKLEVAAAESYAVTEEEIDGALRQVITFTIRPSGWSDGVAAKADDFAFAIQRLADPATGAPYASEIVSRFYMGAEAFSGKATIEELGVTATDEKTLRCVMAEPRGDNLVLFTAPQLSPVRRDVFELHGAAWADNAETFVSNGVFELTAATPGDVMLLTKNKNYWYRKYTANGTLSVRFGDGSSAVQAVRDGEAMVAIGVPAANLGAAQSGGLMQSSAQQSVIVAEMNHAQAPFNNVKVREAFAKGFDPAAVAVGAASKPAYALIGGAFATRDVMDYPATDLLPKDMQARKAEAAAALAGAGFSGGKGFPSVELLCIDGVAERNAADALAASWSETLGVEVTVSARDAKSFATALQSGDYQIALTEKFCSFDDPSALLGLYASGSTANVSGYDAAKNYDSLLATARAAADTATRSASLSAAEVVLILEDFAVAPVCFPSTDIVRGAGISGLRTDALGRFYLENAQAPGAE